MWGTVKDNIGSIKSSKETEKSKTRDTNLTGRKGKIQTRHLGITEKFYYN